MATYLDLEMPIVEKDPDTGHFKATPYFEDYLYQLVFGLGGEGAEPVSEIISSSVQADKLPYIQGLISKLSRKVTDIDVTSDLYLLKGVISELQSSTASFVTKIKQVNYTAKNKEYIEGRGNITLKFPANARRNDEIIFANGNGGTITLDGNGNNIKYTSTDTTMIMRRKGTSLHFHFFEDNVLNERYWRAR